MEASIRIATEADVAALQDALVLALAWRDPALPPDPESYLRESGHGHLIEHWGRPGDTALVAETPAGVAGAAWYRFWTHEDHSYGFVDEPTPELGIGVHHPYRGRGIGKALLVRLLEHARQQGVGRGQPERRARQSCCAPLRRPGLRRRRGGERLYDGQGAGHGADFS